MSQDYTRRLREIAEELYQEAGRMEIAGRALTDAELRHLDALRRALDLVDQALRELESAPLPPARTGEVKRGEIAASVDETIHGPYPARGPVENSGLAGDDDTSGYGRGRGGLDGDDDTPGYGRGGVLR